MKKTLLPLGLAGALMLSACAANETGPSTTDEGTGLSGSLNAMGSSAQSAAQNIWAAGFQGEHPDVTVNYDPQGSGAGRTAFLDGAVAFAGTDTALDPAEATGDLPLCASGAGPVNLPVYISPIAIAYNLPEVPDLRLDAPTLALIFSGRITTWDDERLAGLNPGVDLPDLPVTVVRRADDSGTTENFTDYLAAQAPDEWAAQASQTFPHPIGDAAKGTSGVADAARNTHGSISYLDLSGASGLQHAQLRVGEGFSSLTAEGAATVVASSPLARQDGDLAVDLDRTLTTAGAWPLVLVSYLLVCEEYQDEDLGELVEAYVTHIVTPQAQQAALEGAGSAPLTDDLAQQVRDLIATDH